MTWVAFIVPVQAGALLIGGALALLAARMVIGAWPAVTRVFRVIWLGLPATASVVVAASYGLGAHVAAIQQRWMPALEFFSLATSVALKGGLLTTLIAPACGLVRYPSGIKIGGMESAVIGIVYALGWAALLGILFLVIVIHGRI